MGMLRRNFLLFQGEVLVAKLGDFGFATLDIGFRFDDGKGMAFDKGKRGTVISTGTRPWTPPEYDTEVPWSSAFNADVYSWGLFV
jgi:hypothetical protein